MQPQPTTPNLRRRLREPVYGILTDHLMIVLSLLLIPTTLLPFFFTFSQFMLTLFEVTNYLIIAVFALEYFSKLYVSDSMRAYAADPWHIIDLSIVTLAGVDFLGWIPFEGVGKTSPLLRLLRVGRVFAVAGRTVKRAAPAIQGGQALPEVSRMKVNVFESGKVMRGCSQGRGFQLHSYT